MKYTPLNYQLDAAAEMLAKGHAALFADPGCGKTVTTLTVLEMLRVLDPPMKAIIIAPLRVVMSTWPAEVAKWDHTKHLKVQTLRGKTKQIDPSNDIFLVNPENLKAVFEQKESRIFTVLVIDESTKFKNWMAKRTKLLRKNLKQFKHRYILTGTPAPNGLLDLFAQIHMVDAGVTFGKAITRFKQQYFHPTDYMQYNWEPNDGAEEVIYNTIAPHSIRIDAEQLLELPPFVYRSFPVEIPAKAAEQYKQFEKDLFVELDEADSLTAPTAAAAYTKCRQLASGWFYYGDPALGDVEVRQLHDAKISAAKDIVEDLGGKPVLIAYSYRHELEGLQAAFKGAPYIGGGVSAKRGDELVKGWNNDEFPVLLLHPASVAHGLNMQEGSGRHILWFSLTDNLEHYLQLNRRIRRHGVSSRVFIYHLVAKKTVDEALLQMLGSKNKQQQNLLDALKEYRSRNNGNPGSVSNPSTD